MLNPVALAEMRNALGSENVLTEPDEMADYGDPFAPPGDNEQGIWPKGMRT